MRTSIITDGVWLDDERYQVASPICTEIDKLSDSIMMELFSMPYPSFVQLTLDPRTVEKIRKAHIVMQEQTFHKIEFLDKTRAYPWHNDVLFYTGKDKLTVLDIKTYTEGTHEQPMFDGYFNILVQSVTRQEGFATFTAEFSYFNETEHHTHFFSNLIAIKD